LAHLWKGLGGTSAKKENFEYHLALLSDAAKYRKSAADLVGNTQVQLVDLSEEVGALRKRVARSMLQKGVPIEVLLKSIRASVQTLIEGRRKAVEQGDRIRERNLNGPQHPELAA